MIAVEILIAVFWVIGVIELKKSLNRYYSQVNLNIKRFFIHSLVFTIGIVTYIVECAERIKKNE